MGPILKGKASKNKLTPMDRNKRKSSKEHNPQSNDIKECACQKLKNVLRNLKIE